MLVGNKTPANRRGEANRRVWSPLYKGSHGGIPSLRLDLKSTKKGCKKLSRKLTIVLLVAVALSLSLASVAFATGGDDRDDRDGHHEQGKHYKAHLKALNRSGAEGHATLEKEGNKKVETDPRLQKSTERVPDLGRLRRRQPDHHRGGAALLRTHPGLFDHHRRHQPQERSGGRSLPGG